MVFKVYSRQRPLPTGSSAECCQAEGGLLMSLQVTDFLLMQVDPRRGT